MKVSKKRWLIAQNYEKKFWLKNRTDAYNKEIDKSLIYKVKKIKEEIKHYIKLSGNSKLLQIGGAYRDVINFFDVGKKFNIDPLMDFYLENFPIKKNNIKFSKGVGENLPYKSNYFNIIFIINTLDHTQNPNKVLSEIYRTLKSDGIMYLEVNTFTKIGILIRRFLELFKIDKGHPHTFDYGSIKNLIRNNRFKLIKEGLIDKKSLVKKMKHNTNIKLSILGHLNMIVIPYKAIYKK